MKNKVILCVTLTDATQVQQLTELPASAGLIELRADLFNIDFTAIKNIVTAPLLFTLKSKLEGGLFNGSKKLRIKELINASTQYSFIALEGERDLVPEILNAIPPEKRIICWQGASENYETLKKRFEKYLATPARYYQLVTEANKSGEELPVLQLLKAYKRNNLVTYAIGPIGIWTQPFAAFLGSPMVPSVLNNDHKYQYFSAKQLMQDYDLPSVYRVENVFGITGNPVLGSISPKLHNEAYRVLKLPYLYLPFHTNTFQQFFDEIINKNLLPINLSGLTVVSPFKEAGLKAASATHDEDVLVSGACNMLLHQNKTAWAATSTDALGVIDALDKISSNWKQKNIVLIGCGGTGRTIAAAFKRMNVKFTIVNRTVSSGKKIALVMGVPFISMDAFNPSAFNIIIHATPLGKNKGELPFDITFLQHDCVVIDHVYSLPEETMLVKYCRLCNIAAVDGVEMARLQIRHQFKKMTGINMPDINKKNKTVSAIVNQK